MSDTLKLFVYGSLKVGECNDRVIKNWLKTWEPASLRGQLRLRPDKYPALFLAESVPLGSDNYEQDLLLNDAGLCRAGDVVSGQLLTLERGAYALRVLDEFEGFFPGRRSEYLRAAVLVRTGSESVSCWTYVGAGNPPPEWAKLASWPPAGLVLAPEPYTHGL